ncbi:MAG: DM13 domain-containing protein [Sebaldella sp.]|mgnify:CR=1 FL=1|nr:DM13 domain-containing protein [Sebaldella sp.]
MKKLLLVIGVLCLSLSAFAEKLNGTFEGKLHEVSGEITADTDGKEVVISNFTYDGKGKNVYIVLTKDGDFKNSEIISKELKKAVVNDELKIKVNNLSKLIDKGYNTVSVYTKTGKSSFGDAVLTKEASVTVTPVAPTTPAPKK